VVAFLPKAMVASGFTDKWHSPAGELGAHLAGALLRIKGGAQ